MGTGVAGERSGRDRVAMCGSSLSAQYERDSLMEPFDRMEDVDASVDTPMEGSGVMLPAFEVLRERDSDGTSETGVSRASGDGSSALSLPLSRSRLVRKPPRRLL